MWENLPYLGIGIILGVGIGTLIKISSTLNEILSLLQGGL